MESYMTNSSSGCSSDEGETSSSTSSNPSRSSFHSQFIVWTNSQLFYIGRDCQSLPEILGDNYGEQCRRLDLSYNILSTLKSLDKFTNLEELILDNNQLDDTIRFPLMPNLKTLSLNKNKKSNNLEETEAGLLETRKIAESLKETVLPPEISCQNLIKDLESFLDKVVSYLPGLQYLSLHGNPACPNQLSCVENDEEDYLRYRLRVLYRLPKLNFLDSSPVKKMERIEAKRVGAYTKVLRPATITTGDGSNGDYDDNQAYSPLPQTLAQDGVHRGAYGICRYKYLGLHSEGNRFIRNNDL